MECTNCKQQIDPIRLEVLPDTTVCKRCAQSREPVIPKVDLPPALDPQPYIEAKVPYKGLGRRSIYLNKHKRQNIQQMELDDSPPQGYPKTLRKRKLDRHTDNKIPITFHSYNSIQTYYYKKGTVLDKFEISPDQLDEVLTYKDPTLYVRLDVLYVDYKDGNPPHRLGKYYRREKIV